MPSNPMTRANIIDQTNNIIGSTLTTTWTDAKINQLIDNALSEVSEAVPYIMREVYQIETRTGAATSTSSDNLVDATNSQFASTDVGKVVYNTTDNTWAEIKSCSVSTTVGLTKNIFTVGEGYEIYNKGCWASNQININTTNDFLWIVDVAYPVDSAGGAWEVSRNFNLIRRNEFDNILEIDVVGLDNTKETTANKDVYIYMAKQHKLNLMTDLVGASESGAAVDATSMSIDGLTNADLYVYKDTLFYFTQIGGVTMNSRNIYRVTADAAIGSLKASVSFYPPLECAITTADDVTFIGSTLTPDLERLLIDIVTGQILMAEGISKINAFSIGGQAVPSRSFDMGRGILERARMQLKSLVDVELRANKVLAR